MCYVICEGRRILPYFLILLYFLLYCRVGNMVKLRVLMWVINISILFLKQAWGRNHSLLLLGQFILKYIPVHLFKAAASNQPV